MNWGEVVGGRGRGRGGSAIRRLYVCGKVEANQFGCNISAMHTARLQKAIRGKSITKRDEEQAVNKVILIVLGGGREGDELADDDDGGWGWGWFWCCDVAVVVVAVVMVLAVMAVVMVMVMVMVVVVVMVPTVMVGGWWWWWWWWWWWRWIEWGGGLVMSLKVKCAVGDETCPHANAQAQFFCRSSATRQRGPCIDSA